MNSEGAGWFHSSKHGEVCNADFSSNSKTNAAQHGLSVFHLTSAKNTLDKAQQHVHIQSFPVRLLFD